MNKFRLLYISLLLMTLVTSCFKEDEMVTPHQPGDLSEQTIAMGQYYTSQEYFDLGTNSVVGSNSKDIFDLRFSCADSNIFVRLNSAKFIRIANTNDTVFFTVLDTTGQDWFYDAASGNTDSIAIKDWYSVNGSDTLFTHNVYIIDRGIDALGNVQGVRKVRFNAYRNNKYYFEYANLDNSNYYKIEVEKQSERNYVAINLKSGETQLNLEPIKDEWDFVFTQYTDILTTSNNEDYPYLVTGVLLNPNNVLAAMDTTMDFDQITIADVIDFEFTKRENFIGYQWKLYDFDAGYYTVLTDNNYIIKDVAGYYYKLRFVGFYNNIGEKGYPKFEFQRL